MSRHLSIFHVVDNLAKIVKPLAFLELVAALTCGALSGIDEGWRWMLGLALAPAIIQLLGFIFILPEVILTWQDTSKKTYFSHRVI